MAKSSSVDTDISFGVPGIDFGAVIASQRKNIDALTEANKIAVEGIQAVVSRQFEIGRQTADEISTIILDFVQPKGSVEDRVARQAEYSKQAVEKGLSSAREIGELMTKVGTEAMNVIGKRVAEGVDEVRDYAKKHVASR
jgi:phasin family protein